MGRFADWLLGPVPATPNETRSDEPGPSDPSTVHNIPSRNAVAKRPVSSGEALGVSMVYRATQIHAIAAKQLSIQALRERDGKPLPITPTLVRRPDMGLSRSAFIEQAIVSLASQGNAYWLKQMDDSGAVQNLTTLNPLDVEPQANSRGECVGYAYQGGTLAANQIKHLRLLRVPGSLKGLGPIQAAQVELRGALDLRDYSQNWFQESGIPNGVLKSDQHLTADVAEQAKITWNASQGAKKGVAVLGAGLSYQPIFLSPRDAQFLDSQKFTVTQMARLFGVPASLMLASVEGSAQTYSNVEQDWLGYVRFSLMAYLVEIEDAITELLPRGTVAKFNIEALLRADTTTRYAAHKVALDAGFMTLDEVRNIENMPPLPETTTPKEITND